MAGTIFKKGSSKSPRTTAAAELPPRLASQFEERYRTLFESAPIGIGVTDSTGGVIALNRYFRKLAGLGTEEVCLARASDFLADAAQLRQMLAQLRRIGKAEARQALFRKQDGTLIPVLLRLEQIRLTGTPAVLMLAEDITRQKQAERRLEGVASLLKLFATVPERRTYLEAVVNLLRDWCGCECAGVRLSTGKNDLPYAAQVGFSRAFLARENRRTLSDWECPCLRVFLGRARPDDLPCNSEQGSFFCNDSGQFLGKTGAPSQGVRVLACVEARYQSIAHVPLRYAGQLHGSLHLADLRPGKFPVECVNFLESVAPLVAEAIHRFEVEESLQESELRFRSMFERHNAIMLLIDPDTGGLTDVNPAAAAFYRYSREALCQMNFQDLFLTGQGIVVAFRRSALQEERNFFIQQHRLANGDFRTVEVHVSPINVKGRRLLFAIIHDITERKLLEQAVLEIGQRERHRLGQDLHDALGGRLAGAALLGKTLARKLSATHPAEAELAEEIARCVNESIGHTRAIARGLMGFEFDGSGLRHALIELLAETQLRSGVICRLYAPKVLQTQDQVAAAHLFRIAQEATTNALRHGQPHRITLRIRQSKDLLSLEIRDDGSGFQPKPRSKGLGLRSMRYRAEALGGELTVTRGEKGGTIVRCVAPAPILLARG